MSIPFQQLSGTTFILYVIESEYDRTQRLTPYLPSGPQG